MKKNKKRIYPERSRRIGLLGLSANPPHNGHLEAARLILRKKLADVVWLIPCYNHPFDKTLISSEHRWKMALLMESKKIKVNDAEFKLKGVSYTIKTVKALKKKHPDCDFLWIVGFDIVKNKSYKRWKDWKELSSLINFLAVPRTGIKITKTASNFILVKGRVSNVSSTEIRERIGRGLPINGLVPHKIKEYIEKHKLYQN